MVEGDALRLAAEVLMRTSKSSTILALTTSPTNSASCAEYHFGGPPIAYNKK